MYTINLGGKACTMYFEYESTLQKQPFADIFQNRCSYGFRIIHRITLVLEFLLNKVSDLTDCNFIKKRFQHRCFTLNIANFLRKAFLQNTTGGCFCTLGTTVPENIDRRHGKKHSHNTFSYNYMRSPTQPEHNSWRSKYSDEKTLVTCNV